MRIRSIKPEFYRSEDIAALDWETRLLFIGLWSYVDDNGVGRDTEPLILADLFPLDRDPRESLARVSRGLASLSEGGLIDRYTVEGRRYLAITGWSKHQRIDKPNAPRYPGPDQGFPSDSRAPREIVATPSRLEQGNRGTEEQGNRGKNTLATASLESEFAAAWEHWPKKVERKQALERFKAAGTRYRGEVGLIAEVIRFGDAYAATTERQFVPALGVWLNGDRWTDELPQPRRGSGAERQQQGLSLVAQYRTEEERDEEVGDRAAAALGAGRGWPNAQ